MINFLRAPIVNTDWDEMIERTKSKDHPSVQAAEFIMRHHPETKSEFDEVMHSAENYIENLKKAMDIDSLEDLSSGSTELGISKSLANAARRAMVSVIAFWDSTDAGEEFILPKLPGITEMDYVSILHKTMVLQARRNELEEEWLPDDMDMEIKRMLYGSAVFSENYSVYPISPTRCIICFSPYFRAFFPTRYAGGKENVYPPLLKENQFYNSFYISPRIELFEPCEARFNKSYLYQVKQLTRDEVYYIDSMLLDMETEEFAFHEIDRIKNSLWYYDNQAVFAGEKKHDFSNLYS
jgi:hypothetical protein